MDSLLVPILLFAACSTLLAVGLLAVGGLLGPKRASRVKEMPYESGMDPIHDARRRFDVRFHLVGPLISATCGGPAHFLSTSFPFGELPSETLRTKRR